MSGTGWRRTYSFPLLKIYQSSQEAKTKSLEDDTANPYDHEAL